MSYQQPQGPPPATTTYAQPATAPAQYPPQGDFQVAQGQQQYYAAPNGQPQMVQQPSTDKGAGGDSGAGFCVGCLACCAICECCYDTMGHHKRVPSLIISYPVYSPTQHQRLPSQHDNQNGSLHHSEQQLPVYGLGSTYSAAQYPPRYYNNGQEVVSLHHGGQNLNHGDQLYYGQQQSQDYPYLQQMQPQVNLCENRSFTFQHQSSSTIQMRDVAGFVRTASAKNDQLYAPPAGPPPPPAYGNTTTYAEPSYPPTQQTQVQDDRGFFSSNQSGYGVGQPQQPYGAQPQYPF
ncbi:hypothetical protein BCR33DRAFT_855044 [Rhizoclosmatium globosum]|uniref:Uncharacterized protein n=1 Tax=Rhizoclosmatium globosum TaxID=329046 RepID=A0A1Y2BQI3_9FUNG|nr:hypothetical protein BCR33DRAFT_855044 [Rhizoclosmatium globosum]|eukprot:ORY36897.1 hypothetical protein BCR33DRAFT_855044 [Rhizoclosmatium globosum]